MYGAPPLNAPVLILAFRGHTGRCRYGQRAELLLQLWFEDKTRSKNYLGKAPAVRAELCSLLGYYRCLLHRLDSGSCFERRAAQGEARLGAAAKAAGVPASTRGAPFRFSAAAAYRRGQGVTARA